MCNKKIEKKGKKKTIISVIKSPFIFLVKWRPFPLYEMISYFLMFASVPLLAYESLDYNFELIKILVFTEITLYSAFFAAIIWNDITDAEIDAVVHPQRPIPSGRISKNNFFAIALFFSATTFIFAFLVNIYCLAIVGFTALFVAIHNKYLKKMIKIPAYSEIFTPLQWISVVLFGYFAVWSNIPNTADIIISIPILGPILINSHQLIPMILLVIFTYFADNSHDLVEGIHDVKGDKKLGVRTYATSFGEKTTKIISFGMFIFSGIIAIILFVINVLSVFFIIPFIIFWLYTAYWPYKLMKIENFRLNMFSSIVGRKLFDYYLMTFNFIFLDVVLRLILNSLDLGFL